VQTELSSVSAQSSGRLSRIGAKVSRRVWQIASGEAGRKYTELFLRHDVMFCGPGEVGEFDPKHYRAEVARGAISGSVMGQVRNFASKVKPGDIALLRSGYRVVSIGAVDGAGYRFDPIFDDVYGSDLQHTQRVIWQNQLDEELEELQSSKLLFANRKQIPTFTGVEDRAILDPIEHLFDKIVERPLKELPPAPPPPLTMDKLSEALFSRGLSFEAVRRVRDAIEKQRGLIEWYRRRGSISDRPTEHELIAHIVLPLLVALGWSEQWIAIEWHKIDLALFVGTPTDKEHCKLVCEAKAIGHGLQDVLVQARDYVEKQKLANCDKLLVTDGQGFYLYRRTSALWPDEPAGYLNVFKIREDHLCAPGTNAVDTLMALTPAAVAT
jgi:hypothetical protein